MVLLLVLVLQESMALVLVLMKSMLLDEPVALQQGSVPENSKKPVLPFAGGDRLLV